MQILADFFLLLGRRFPISPECSTPRILRDSQAIQFFIKHLKMKKYLLFLAFTWYAQIKLALHKFALYTLQFRYYLSLQIPYFSAVACILLRHLPFYIDSGLFSIILFPTLADSCGLRNALLRFSIKPQCQTSVFHFLSACLPARHFRQGKTSVNPYTAQKQIERLRLIQPFG